MCVTRPVSARTGSPRSRAASRSLKRTSARLVPDRPPRWPDSLRRLCRPVRCSTRHAGHPTGESRRSPRRTEPAPSGCAQPARRPRDQPPRHAAGARGTVPSCQRIRPSPSRPGSLGGSPPVPRSAGEIGSTIPAASTSSPSLCPGGLVVGGRPVIPVDVHADIRPQQAGGRRLSTRGSRRGSHVPQRACGRCVHVVAAVVGHVADPRARTRYLRSRGDHQLHRCQALSGRVIPPPLSAELLSDRCRSPGLHADVDVA